MPKIVESTQEQRIQVKLNIENQRSEGKKSKMGRKLDPVGVLLPQPLCILRALFLLLIVPLLFLASVFCYNFWFFSFLPLL